MLNSCLRRLQLTCVLFATASMTLASGVKPLAPLNASTWRPTSSYCTIFAGESAADGLLLLWSIALTHPRARVYVGTTTHTRDWLQSVGGDLLATVDVVWSLILDRYNLALKRDGMERSGVWSDFQMEKANIISTALASSNDTLYVDADMLFLAPVSVPDTGGYSLGLSAHGIIQSISDKHGEYNGGFLWTSDPTVPAAWNNATKFSRFFDQAALEDLAQAFPTFLFDQTHNVGWWRMALSERGADDFVARTNLRDGALTIDDNTVTTLHAHFVRANVSHETWRREIAGGMTGLTRLALCQTEADAAAGRETQNSGALRPKRRTAIRYHMVSRRAGSYAANANPQTDPQSKRNSTPCVPVRNEREQSKAFVAFILGQLALSRRYERLMRGIRWINDGMNLSDRTDS